MSTKEIVFAAIKEAVGRKHFDEKSYFKHDLGFEDEDIGMLLLLIGTKIRFKYDFASDDPDLDTVEDMLRFINNRIVHKKPK